MLVSKYFDLSDYSESLERALAYLNIPSERKDKIMQSISRLIGKERTFFRVIEAIQRTRTLKSYEKYELIKLLKFIVVQSIKLI